MYTIEQYPSPNYDQRKLPITILVFHYTGMRSAQDALHRMCQRQAAVSAHYMITENGQILQLVDEQQRAWHAGISYWRGINDVNSASIGIELVNKGHEFGYHSFPDAQIHATISLAADIITRYQISAQNIVGHSDIAPSRKQDPGELFPWKQLAKNNIGLWPYNDKNIFEKDAQNSTYKLNIAELQSKLSQYGYFSPKTNHMDEQTKAVIIAFQRHFRPQKINGIWDKQCSMLLDNLLHMI